MAIGEGADFQLYNIQKKNPISQKAAETAAIHVLWAKDW